MDRGMQSESITELAKALVRAQAAFAPAIKDSKNPFLGTRYASLSSVMDASKAALLENGLAVVQCPAPAPEHLGQAFIGLETKLLHAESGQWISSLAVIPLMKPDPQAMGAAISYARRYALSAMLGIVSEEDNDCETRIPARNGRNDRNTPPDCRAPDDIWGEPKQRNGRNGGNSVPKNEPPALPGVNYDVQQGNDGRQYIIATGNTRENKEILKQAGFSWNSQRSVWYRLAA